MNRLTHQRTGKRATLRVALLLGTLGCAASVQAIDVYFTGTLVKPPPCVINGDTDISVNFGNQILAGRVDGTAYEESITYNLDCSVGAAISPNLRMKLQGDVAGFGSDVLSTSKADLGLELRNNGAKLPVNSWINFIDPARPVLSAVPVKALGSTLSGGAFTAAATLLVDYQ